MANRRQFIKGTLASSVVLSQTSKAGLFSNKPSGAMAAPVANTIETYPAIIIGSGYGGAVSALHLTSQGYKTLILEMGMDWTGFKQFSKMITPNRTACWLKTQTPVPIDMFRIPVEKYTGVLDRVDYQGIKVYRGIGFGGGSLVNGGMAVTPRLDYFKEMLPDVDAIEMYTKYFPIANRRLKVNTINDAFYKKASCYQYARAGIAQAEKAGFKTTFVPNVYDFNYMEQEEAGLVPKSATSQEVIFGNNYGKNSIDKTYHAIARATGNLSLKTLRRVTTISQKTNGDYLLQVEVLNTVGAVIGYEQYITPKLFVNAGSIGTTELLVKARETGTLPKLTIDVGQGWGHNGNVMSGRNFTTANGITQSTMPIAGINRWDDPVHPSFTEISPFPVGLETWTSLYLSITKNPNRASFNYNRSTGKVVLNWTIEQATPSIAAARDLLMKLNAANGGSNAIMMFPDGGVRGDI